MKFDNKYKFIEYIFSEEFMKFWQIKMLNLRKNIILSKFSTEDIENPKIISLITQWHEIWNTEEQAILK